jgi:uncharacterized protein (DUF433 family)
MERIVIDKRIRHGKPVDVILGSLAGGMSYEEICKEYGIKKEDILAAIEYQKRKLNFNNKII